MPFVNPAIFWLGLALVAAPILIHILNRRRFRVREWAAMQFLLESLRKNRRRLRVEELILLALRCLLIVAAAAALGRFTGCQAMRDLPIAGSDSQSVVFILDDSPSMGQKQGAGSLFAAACADLAEKIRSLPKSSPVGIILTSSPDAAQALLPLNLVTDMNAVLSRLADRKPSDVRARLDRALASAGEMLASQKGPKRVYIYSDFRRCDLASPQDARMIRQHFAQLASAGVEIVAFDYGRQASSNLTIESIELLDKFVVAGGPRGPARFAVTVRNNGPAPVESVPVSVALDFYADGQPHRTEPPVLVLDSVSSGQAKRLEFHLTCPQPGPAVLSARLGADEFDADNAGRLALNVRPAVRVLVVDGKAELTDATESESFFFVNAIDDGQGSYGNRPDVVTPQSLASVGLAGYDLVVLMNVQKLAEVPGDEGQLVCPMLETLEKYVRDGGGLAIFMGDQVDRAFYNGPMYAGGLGLCPLTIGQRVGQDKPGDEFYRLDSSTVAAEPMLDKLRGEAAAFIGLIRFYAFVPADERSSASAEGIEAPRVLARFCDPQRSPAVAARRLGKGQVVLFYTTGCKRWNDWPIDEIGTYVGVMLDMIAQLARPQDSLTAKVGEPIDCRLPAELADVRVSLKTPGYPASDLVALAPLRTVGGSSLRFEPANEAGTYEMTLTLPDGSVRPMLLARNIEPSEGDLAPALRQGIAAAFESEKFTYISRQGAGPAGKEPGVDKDYWRWLLAAFLAMLAAELLLAQRFGHYSSTTR